MAHSDAELSSACGNHSAPTVSWYMDLALDPVRQDIDNTEMPCASQERRSQGRPVRFEQPGLIDQREAAELRSKLEGMEARLQRCFEAGLARLSGQLDRALASPARARPLSAQSPVGAPAGGWPSAESPALRAAGTPVLSSAPSFGSSNTSGPSEQVKKGLCAWPDTSMSEHSDTEPTDSLRVTVIQPSDADATESVRVSATETDRLSRMYKTGMKKRKTVEAMRVDTRWIARFVNHPYFTVVVIAFVWMNAAALSAQIHYEAVSDQPTAFFVWAETLFAAFFTCELFMRFLAQPKAFCSPSDRYWNAFDCVIVFISLCDLVMMWSAANTGFVSGFFAGKFVRIMKLAKVVRVCRTVRFMGQLRAMLIMIGRSFSSLTWVATALFMILLMFSLVLTQGATEYLKPEDGSPPEDADLVAAHFGSVFHSMYTLFLSMTNGQAWGVTVTVAERFGIVYSAVVFIFVFFTTFSVLNIVTGVFVEGAIEMTKTDRMMLLENTSKHRAAMRQNIIQLLIDIDQDGDGGVSYEEFAEAMERDDVKEFMFALQIDIGRARAMFQLMDRDHDGIVDIVEFVEGMEKLNGEAASSDIQMLILQVGEVLEACEVLTKSVADRMQMKPLVTSEEPDHFVI